MVTIQELCAADPLLRNMYDYVRLLSSVVHRDKRARLYNRYERDLLSWSFILETSRRTPREIYTVLQRALRAIVYNLDSQTDEQKQRANDMQGRITALKKLTAK